MRAAILCVLLLSTPALSQETTGSTASASQPNVALFASVVS